MTEKKETKFDSLIKQIEEMPVAELAELVKLLEEKFGVSAAPVVAAGGTGNVQDSGKAEEKDSFDVYLESVGDNKIQIIKTVKEVTGLGLKESKDLVDAAPKVIKEGVKKEEAEEIKKKFEEAGGKVSLK